MITHTDVLIPKRSRILSSYCVMYACSINLFGCKTSVDKKQYYQYDFYQYYLVHACRISAFVLQDVTALREQLSELLCILTSLFSVPCLVSQ